MEHGLGAGGPETASLPSSAPHASASYGYQSDMESRASSIPTSTSTASTKDKTRPQGKASRTEGSGQRLLQGSDVIQTDLYGATVNDRGASFSKDAEEKKSRSGFRTHFNPDEVDERGARPERRPAVWGRSFQESVRAFTPNLDSMLGIMLDPDTGTEMQTPRSCDMSNSQAAIAIIKSFVASGITFMPGAFSHGGWFFSTVVLAGIGVVNAICIWLLLDCRARCGCPGFGEIASLVAGRPGKVAVQISLVVSQFGVCTAFMIFVSQLSASFGMSPSLACFSQLIIVVPLCMIRSVDKLLIPNLIADVLILFGIVVVLVFAVMRISENGPHESIRAFEPTTCGLFLGTAIYTFEGIPMVLPIRNAMREPEQFWGIFIKLFAAIVSLFCCVGFLGYLAYGADVHTVVLLSLPHHSALSVATKVCYMLALICSLPLMFLPAARITELWAFGIVQKGGYKWSINFMRFCEVFFFAIVARFAGSSFDRFLAFVGAFFCCPIALVYPALFHLKLCAKTKLAKALDCSLLALGLFVMVIAFCDGVLPHPLI